MPTTYCPHSGCGASVDYTGTKPLTCPKCRRAFASAFARAVETVEEAPPLRRRAPVTASKKPVTLVKRTRPSRFADLKDTAPASTIMNPADEIPAEVLGAAESGDDGEGYDGTDASPEEIAQYAEELKAALNEDDIIIDMGEQPERFRGYYNAGNKAKS